MVKANSFNFKKLLAGLVGLSIIFGLLFMALPQAAGAEEPIALTVKANGVTVQQFTMEELEALPQKTYDYSRYNFYPSLQFFKDTTSIQ